MSSPEPLCGALAGFTLVRFLVFSILANWFPNHRTARTSKSEYSINEIEQKEGEGISQNAPNINPAYRYDLSDKSWFVYDDNYGTTEEKRFVRYFATQVEELKKVYETVYLNILVR